MREPRSLWLVTLDGVPVACSWAFVRTPEEATPGREANESALDPNLGMSVAGGWDAVRTAWRSVPRALWPDCLADNSPTLVGRVVTNAGLAYDLDSVGAASPLPGGEPLAPHAVVVDQDAADASGVAYTTA